MKPTSTCDVEISITMDGMETVEPVPECLQEAFLSNSPRDTWKMMENHVILPKRFAQHISNNTDSQKSEIQRVTADDKMTDRERDIGTALSWIKQEIVSII